MNTSPNTMNHPRRAAVMGKAIVAIVLVCGIAGGLYAARVPTKPAPNQPVKGAGTADRALARKVAFEITTTANGELEARKKEEYRNPLDQESTITQIVPEGTRVKAGDLIVQLNVEEIQLKVDEQTLKVESARADKIAAESNLAIQENENASKLRQAELKLALADLALAQWRDGDVEKKRNDLNLDADKAALELERLAQLYQRSQNLNREGFLSKDQLDKDEVLYIEAIANYKTSRLALSVYDEFEYRKDEKKFLSDVEEARAEVERVKLNNISEVANKRAEFENRKNQLLANEAKLTKLTKQRDEATIYARKDGLVVFSTTLDRGMRWGGGGDGPLQIGTQVSPNQLLIVLPDTSEMVAALRVHESMSAKVRPGQPVTVKIDAAGGATFQGTVDSIGVMAETGGWRDPNLREYTVRVALDTQADNLKPAMRCEGRIILDTVPETLTVPVQSVFNEGPVQFVYVTAGQKFTKQPVRLGRRSDTIAEISAGLAEGDPVLIREPSAGEVLAEPWSREVLLAVGYKIGEDGKVIAEGGGPMPTRSAPRGGNGQGGEQRQRGGGKPQNAAPGGMGAKTQGPGKDQPKPAGEITTAASDQNSQQKSDEKADAKSEPTKPPAEGSTPAAAAPAVVEKPAN